MSSDEEEINTFVFWFLAVWGIYLWSVTFCCVSAVREAQLNEFSQILAHKDKLVCQCKESLPAYECLMLDKALLPSYSEAVLMV